MNHLGTEHLIVYAFLFVTLFLGLWAGRSVKDIRDYAIANKTYGTGVLTITFLATYLGGSNTIGIQKNILSYGIVAGFAVIGSSIMYVYAGVFIIPKMMRFKRSITLGDLMQELYGPYGGVITGIMGGLYTISLASIQILAMGCICEALLGWPVGWSIGVGGLILILYSSFGGVKSVTITDIFQFIVFIVVIPLIANLAISEVGGVKILLSQVPSDKLTVFGNEQFPFYFFSVFLVWCLLPTTIAQPPVVQRILMARHTHQAKHMLFITAAFLLVVRVLVLLTCLAVLVLAPNIEPGPGSAFFYIVNEYFPPVLKGLSAAGMLAVVMSTLDSFLNAGGLLLTHNVLKPGFDKVGVAFDELKWVRYITFLMGCVSILAALNVEDMITLNFFSTSSFAPVVAFPLVAGILGLKPDTRAFLIACFTTLATFLFSNLILPSSLIYLLFPICLTANVVTFLGMYIFRYGGIAVVQQTKGREKQDQSYSYTYETKQLVFALFICFNYMVPYFMYTRAAETTMFAIKFVGILLCVGLLLKPYWPASFRKYFDTYWHFCLLYCLPFTTTVLYLLNGGGLEWTINIALAIMLLLILVDWKRFTIISLTGLGLGMLYVMPTALSYENAHALAYAVTFSTLVGLLFSRRKEYGIAQTYNALKGEGEAHQANLLQATAERQAALKALQYTGVGKLLTITRKLQHMHVAAAEKEELENLQRELIPMAFQLQGLGVRSQDYLRLHIEKDLPIAELLSAVKGRLQENGVQANVRISNEAQCQKITGDSEQLVTLLAKSITALQGSIEEEEQVILMSLKDTRLSYPLPDVEKGCIKYVPALRIAITTEEQLPAIAPYYQPDLSNTPATTSETTQDLDRLANSRIIKAHYGYAEMTSDTLLYVVPVDVREVRFRDMDKAYMEVGAKPQRANDHFIDKERGVDAQAQEATFLADVAARSKADLGLVKVALELIKWYHGPVNRKSHEPFYLHPLAVAQIVLDYNQDQATIIGALLHDTVEDTPMQIEHVAELFGKQTAAVVDLVTHLQSIPGSIYKVKMSASENLQMLEQAGNKQGLYVKLADRMHNMRTINGHSKVSKRKLVAQETMDFFVPLAVNLGLHQADQEFRERCKVVLSQQA